MQPDHSGDTDSLDLAERVAPTLTGPLGRGAARPIGGPLGEHAQVGRQWFWTPLRFALLIAVLALTVSWFGKVACIQQFTNSQGQFELDWRTQRPYITMCYTDVVPLYGAEQLDRPDTFPYKTSFVEDKGKPTQQTRYMEYPVLAGLFQWVNAKLTAGWLDMGLLQALPVAVYFNITAFFLALAWLVTVWATARIARRRPWDALLVAASPLILVHAYTNFDALATAATAAAILAWSRKKPVLAGILLGLGVATKFYPLFLLGVLFVLCLRAGKLREWQRTTVATLVTWLAVNAPIALAYPTGWWEFFRRNTIRPADIDSIWNAISEYSGWPGFDGNLRALQTPTALNIVTALLFLACCLAIAWTALAAPVRPRFAQLAFLLIASFLLVNKVWSPQYSLWLVPLAVLAIPRWKVLLTWMFVDALVWFPRMMYYLGVDHKGLPIEWFLGFVLLRDVVVVGLCALVVYEIYHPERDLVRKFGDDDPAGGVFNRSPDVFRLGRSPVARSTSTDHTL
ncbi:glycosyltransferase family 87 protein [Actinocrispum wychmicini]|uniref:Putative membrane protein n=1 Tax=Actinocrispum wychmicini TaxID=1213861 RepID=A0A4R2JXX8_9PSEU|nr:glycosyltransferase 87 family protein [Actinocrispum wychmicini]TCO64734.1 putative membrane protein [Actinocrispum wychmicini]